MILDGMAGVICFLLAACVATINILSSPTRRHWLDFPEWVRAPLFPAAACFVFRGAELISSAGGSGPYQIKPGGIVALLAIGYLAASVTGYIISRTYPIRVWDRLKWIERKVSCQSDSDEVPVLMQRAKILDMLNGGGAFVAAPAPGGLDDAHVRSKSAVLH